MRGRKGTFSHPPLCISINFHSASTPTFSSVLHVRHPTTLPALMQCLPNFPGGGCKRREIEKGRRNRWKGKTERWALCGRQIVLPVSIFIITSQWFILSVGALCFSPTHLESSEDLVFLSVLHIATSQLNDLPVQEFI